MVKIPPSNAGDSGSIPGPGTEVPHEAGCGQKFLKKEKKKTKGSNSGESGQGDLHRINNN